MNPEITTIAILHSAALMACGLTRYVLPSLATLAALYLAAVLILSL